MRLVQKLALPLLATMAMLLVVPSEGTAKRLNVSVGLPGPGQTVMAVAQLRFRGKAPRALRVRLPAPARLDPRYRGLYAVYRRRRGRTTLLTLITLVLRREDRARRSSGPTARSSDSNDEFQLALFFSLAGFGPGAHLLETAAEDERPTQPSAKITNIFDLGGVQRAASIRNGDLGAHVVDTGHYDDGHSWGWNSAGTNRALGDWLHLTADNAPYEELIREIEEDLSSDLDGDGREGGGSGGTVDTEVKPPVIN
jgi:hypothetical protein